MNIRLNGNLLELRFPYNAELVAAVKEIPGRKWNPQDKVWTVPTTSAYEVYLLCKRLSEVTFEGDAKKTIFGLAEKTAKSISGSYATSADVNFPVPAGRDFYPYQKAGIKFALDRQNTLIADEMGLGKSAQAIGVTNVDKTLKRIVVICPASVKLNWRREINMWSTRKPEIAIGNGSAASWDTIFISSRGTQWLVINYDVVGKWKPYLVDIDLLVLDESHYLKNYKAQRTQNILGYRSTSVNIEPIKAKKIIALTGTPIVNRPVEAWNIVHAFAPETFKSWKYYVDRYCAAKLTSYGYDVSGASNLEELQSRLRSTIMIRRRKEDVLKELPPKIRQVIELPTDDKTKPVVNRELQSYLDRVKSLEDAVEAAKNNKGEYERAVANLAKGRKAFFAEMSELRHKTAVAKIPAILQHLHDAFEGGSQKIVCFAWHYDVIDAIRAEFPNSVGVTGKDKITDRQAAIDKFQQDPNCNLFVGNIRAAGVGITLTASSHVVFAELDWVPGNISQAEDRCHRIGQRNSVLVQHLVLEGSLDATMARMIVEKQKVLDAALDDVPQAAVGEPKEIKPIEIKIKPVEFVTKQLPEGRRFYAVDNESGEVTFLRITAIYANGKPRITFVDQFLGGGTTQNRGRVLENGQYIGTFKELYEKVAADPETAMMYFGKKVGRCGYCNLPLTNTESREFGIGPICRSRAFGN